MSMRVIRGGNGGDIEIPGDEVIMEMKVYKSGKMMLNAPTLHPRECCKVLYNASVDLIFGCFQGQEQGSNIEIPKNLVN